MPTDPLIPFRCLLIEDDHDHAFLTICALRQHELPVLAEHRSDGETAIEYLEELVRRGEALPGLVLLDLNLPGIQGHEVLRLIKHSPELCLTPVVMLTTSKADRDRQLAYHNNANGYLVKPAQADGFTPLANAIMTYWGQFNEPPPSGVAIDSSQNIVLTDRMITPH